MLKKITILVLIFIVAVLFWLSVNGWVMSPVKFAIPSVWIMPLVWLVALSSLVGLAFLLFRELWLKNLVFLVAGLPAVLIFGFNLFFLLALVLIFLFWAVAIRYERQELEERVKINARTIIRQGLPLIIAPMLMAVSFAYYQSPSIQQAAVKNQLPPTISQVIEKTVNTFLGTEIKKLPPQQREQAKNQVIGQVVNQFTVILKPYLQYLPPILAFGLYLVLQGLSFIFVWLAMYLAGLIFWVLKKSGVVRIRVVEKEAEELEF